jgi:hypothetical protein
VTQVFIVSDGLAGSTNGHAAVMCDLSDLNPAPGWYKVAKSTSSEVLLTPSGDQATRLMYNDGVWSWWTGFIPADAHQVPTGDGDTHEEKISAALYHLAQEQILINIKYIDLIYKHLDGPETYAVDPISPVAFRAEGVCAVVMPIKI